MYLDPRLSASAAHGAQIQQWPSSASPQFRLSWARYSLCRLGLRWSLLVDRSAISLWAVVVSYPMILVK